MNKLNLKVDDVVLLDAIHPNDSIVRILHITSNGMFSTVCPIETDNIDIKSDDGWTTMTNRLSRLDIVKDSLITFRTAKLAKRKGFNESFRYYDINGKLGLVLGLCSNVYPAPTQSELQTYLREVHNISVVVETGWSDNQFVYQLVIWIKSKDICYYNTTYTNHNQALEIGLSMGLNYINK